MKAKISFLHRWRVLAVVALLAWAASGQAQTGGAVAQLGAPANEVRTEQVQARLLAHAPQGVAAGKPVWLGLQLVHQPQWHTYWKNPGDSGLPTRFTWKLPDGMQAGEPQWPVPERLPVGPLANYGYDGTILLPVPLTVPAGVPASGSVQVKLDASWLVCKQECIPQQGSFTMDLPLGTPLVSHAADFERAQAQAPKALAGASVQASVDPQSNSVVFRSSNLPAGWRGKLLNLYPETPEIITPAAEGSQQWQGGNWQMTLPLHSMRADSPQQLPLVLALRGATDGDGVQRNAAGSPAYQFVAPVQGSWPATQARAELSPALAAALQANAASATAAAPVAAPASKGMTFWLALGGAFLGGLLLNLMPCVFPVLAIKVMGFARHAHSPAEMRLSGLAYTAGVLLSFAGLAALLLALRAAGQQLGWGFQLQNPWLVAGLAALFAMLGLNLAGVFQIGQMLPGQLAKASAQHPVTNSLLSGVLAVLVASPCTAPFMGASLGFAIGLPEGQALLLFVVMGLGLALPVLLGSLFPATLRWLPKPGVWMNTFKHLMAFPMFATVIWLVWVLGHQSGMDGAVALLALLLTGSGLLWALGLSGAGRWPLRAVFAGLLLWLGFSYGGLLGGAGAQAVGSASTVATDARWQPWSEARVQQALQQGQPVFVDYTAAWCVTCQFNKKAVLGDEAFLQAVAQKKVLLLRADWTRNDPAITRSLAALGRNGVPVYVLHNPADVAHPQILTEILTLKDVQTALSALK